MKFRSFVHCFYFISFYFCFVYSISLRFILSYTRIQNPIIDTYFIYWLSYLFRIIYKKGLNLESTVLIVNNNPKTLALMHQIYGFVDLLYSMELVSDEVFNRERSRQVLIDQPRHLWSWLEAAKCCSLPLPPSDQLERPGGDLMTGRSNADDTRLTPSAMSTLQCRAHNLHIASGIEAIVHSPSKHLIVYSTKCGINN